jgi:MGT family glycosyltransferase
VHVLTGEELREEVESVGAHFVDLFDGHPKEDLADDSYPMPKRNITFAAAYAEALAEEVSALEPSLVLYETFAVVGPVVAGLLGLPHVNVMPHHASVPGRAAAARRKAGRVHTSAPCLAAVERLRDVHGIQEASPFYYLDAHSPFLNLYPEPAEYLPAEDRALLEPLSFFGSLTPSLQADGEGAPGHRPDGRRRVLISLGTILWRYFEQEALSVLGVLADGCAELEGLEATISLGGHRIEPAAREALRRPNVEVAEYVDQRSALAGTDVLVTHHGLNSTHEAIFHRVPMLSCPFYGDQPALARRCQELGLALPLSDAPMGGVDPDRLGAALAELDADRAGFEARLEEARGWELRTIAGREDAIDRMLALSERSRSAGAGRG